MPGWKGKLRSRMKVVIPGLLSKCPGATGTLTPERKTEGPIFPLGRQITLQARRGKGSPGLAAC